MTPEERAVIEQAIIWSKTETVGQAEDAGEALQDCVGVLLAARKTEFIEFPPPKAVFLWFPRTFSNVRTGDIIRMGGVEATVLSHAYYHWHADHSKSHWNQSALPHDMIGLRLEYPGSDPQRIMEFDPSLPVEIYLSESEFVACEANGWENRLCELT